MFLRSCLLLSMLLPSVSFGLGNDFKIKSFSVKAPNTPYVGIGQKTREQRFTGESPVTFIEYEINGAPRRLWDDDGFATLFIYQRSLISRLIDNNSQQGRSNGDAYRPGIDTDNFSAFSPLPKPIDPLVASVDRLSSFYKKMKNEDIRVREDPEIAKLYDELIKRIDGVAMYMKSSRFKQVKDIKESGLESLIADLESNHSYNVETDKGEMLNDNIGSLIGQGIPQNFGDPVYARCFDELDLTWITAARNFSSNATGGNGGDGGTYMETKGVDTGK